ncbi:MAG: hypothetical protein RIS70_4320 [Planctomycetota bacterium]
MSRGVGKLVAALAVLFAFAWNNGTQLRAQVKVDEKLEVYKKSPGVSGSIKSVGSDTMNNLMTLWLEGFRKHYPGVRFEVEGKGSNTAPPALIGGTATFGPMSRPMKPDEADAFEKKFGYKPTSITTSIDMLAIYVHKDNPLKQLSLAQADAIFSSTRKLGAAEDITRWGQLGLSGDWQNLPISTYGRNSASGTYSYFKEHALGKGDFKSEVKEQAGSSAVVQAVASDKSAIGYSGIGYKTADVVALPLSAKADGKPVQPEAENAYSGDYPLARPLYLYINHKKGSALDPLRREFVKFILSKEGQEIVLKDGYIPVTSRMAKTTLEVLGIKP